MKERIHNYTGALCNNKYLFAGFYVFLLLLYSAVAVQSYGYDDEFFNINLVEKLGFGAAAYVQHSDIHPPLSYAINAALYSLLHSWTFVRLCSGLLTAGALIGIIGSQRRQWGNGRALVIFLLLALNPAILMWCTGVRWYTYFLPVLLYLVFQQVGNGIKVWALAMLSLTVLGYIEYSTFLIILPVLLLSWVFSKDTAKDRLRYLFLTMLVFFVLYAYQVYVFFTVHLHHKGRQLSHSLLANLQGYFISQVSNQGVFPISFPAVLSIAGFAGIVLCVLRYLLKGTKNRTAIAVVMIYIVAAATLILVGVAWKPRNLILLIPFQVFVIAYFLEHLKYSRMYIGSIVLTGIANVCGCINVFLHKDTTKNSWNLPVKEVMAEIKKENSSDSLVVFTHDPTLTYVLKQEGINVVCLNKSKAPDYSNVKTAIFINTFRGTISRPVYDSLMAEEYSIRNTSARIVRMGYDRYYKWKRKMAEEYPEYEAELLIYKAPKGLDALTVWNRCRGLAMPQISGE